MINHYQNDLQAKLLPYVPYPEKTQKFLDVILSQEMTRAAYVSIQLFLQSFRKGRNAIKIECVPHKKRLGFSLDSIKEDLQAAIIELADQERVKILDEDLEDFLEQLNDFVDKTLHIDRFQRRAPTGEFLRLILNEQIPLDSSESQIIERLKTTRDLLLKLDKLPETLECGVFCVEMTDVWRTLIERGQDLILECSRRLRDSFHKSLLELHEEFERFRKVISFRSMDPALMLANKAEVIRILDEEVPRAVQKLIGIYDRMDMLTQMLQFDPNDHDLLISIVVIRRSLPRHIANHKMFFQRRYNVFTHFVRTRQQQVQTRAQSYSEKLKIINTFTNPSDVDEYLKDMIELKPMILSLLDEIQKLNEYEKVVNFTLTAMPQIELLGKHVDGLWSIFEWTKKFQEFQQGFYEKRRIEANVEEGKEFVENYLNMLTELSPKLEGQRAARHFMVQIRSEVERFRQQFPIVEVLSCARFDDRHWFKMSEIVGYDLSVYSNAKVLQICDLGLGSYVTKLKPIAFMAEREGKISDETKNIEEFWSEAIFQVETSIFWNINLPINLKKLIKIVAEHLEKLQNYRDTSEKDSVFKETHEKWLIKLKKFYQITSKWSKILERWRRVSFVMQHSHKSLMEEFYEFRICAKFWKKFAEHMEKEPKAIKVIEENHVECWLHTVEKHLERLFEGLKNHFLQIRLSSPRMCLISNVALMKLLTNIPIEKRYPLKLQIYHFSLNIIRRECFPFIKDLFINTKNQISGITLEGETFNLLLNVETLTEFGPLEKVQAIEQALNSKILDSYKKYVENREEKDQVSSFTYLVKLLDHYVHPRNQEIAYFDYKIKEDQLWVRNKALKSHEVPLMVEFVSSEKLSGISEGLIKNCASGRVPMVLGRLQDCRLLARNLSQLLVCSVHHSNMHFGVQKEVLDIIFQAAMKNGVILVLENIDQLGMDAKNFLLEGLEKIKTSKIILPRVIFFSTISDPLEGLEESFLHIEKLDPSQVYPKNMTLTLTREDTLSVTSSASPHMKRLSSLRRRQSTPRPKTLADALLNATILAEGQLLELSFACLGLSARETIEEAVQKCQAEVSWVYLDAFTRDQLIAQNSEFGVELQGYLMKNLKEKMKRDLQSSQSVLTTPDDAKDPEKRRLSLTLRPPRFIIFYGYQLFDVHFPVISSLFCAQPGKAEMPPGSY